jgi:hypothetical protein
MLMEELSLSPHLCMRSEKSSSKKHFKYLLRVDFLLKLTLSKILSSVARLSSRLFSSQIIHLSFFRIGQTSIGSTDFLESIGSLGSSILIRMELNGQFLVLFLDFVLRSVFLDFQNVIVIFFLDYCLAEFYLFRCELRFWLFLLLLLFLLSTLSSLRLCGGRSRILFIVVSSSHSV